MFDCNFQNTFRNDDGLIINLDSSKMIDFRPAYALTVHKAQGASFDRPYTIYEHEKMKHDMIYVSLTRTRKTEFVIFGDISIVKPYKGSVYRASFNGKSYIGSAKDVEERWAERKEGKRTQPIHPSITRPRTQSI